MTQRCLLVLACAFVVAPCAPNAQTVVADFVIPEVAKTPYRYVSARPVDADGNPATDEWLLRYEQPPEAGPTESPWIWNQQYRVVAIRNGRLCIGPWFRPLIEPTEEATVELRRYPDGRDRFLVNMTLGLEELPPTEHTPGRPAQTYTRVRVVDLDVPGC